MDASVDQWRHDRSRRTQRYGWRYDYRAKASCQGHHAQAITPDLRLGQLPDRLQTIAQPIFENVVHPDTGQPRFERVPEQCMVWEQSATNESKSKAGSTVFAVGENHNFCCDISHNAKLKPTEKDKGCTQLQQRHRKPTWTGTLAACGRGSSEHTAAAAFTSWSSSPTRRPLGNLSILGQPRR